MFFSSKEKDKLFFEELHIRHLNLLMDLKNNSYNNWFYKMAIINTFEDLKIFLNNLEKNKYKCIIAIQNKRIIGYLYTYPINNKKTCLKINTPEIIANNIALTRRDLIFKLIKNSLSNNNLQTSNWIINANINDNDLISVSRELGFQPLQETILWTFGNEKQIMNNDNEKKFNYKFTTLRKENFKKFLGFLSSNESILIRNILDFEKEDIAKRSDNKCGFIQQNEEILFGVLKDISYSDKDVYSLIKGILWNDQLNSILRSILKILFIQNKNIFFKTYSHDNCLNSFLIDQNLIEIERELILVRNTLIKRDLKSENKINKSFESLFDRINPQGNVYPSPMPYEEK